jgi:hypothetical protein
MLLAYLVMISDNLFLIQFVVPFVIWLWMSDYDPNLRKQWLQGLACVFVLGVVTPPLWSHLLHFETIGHHSVFHIHEKHFNIASILAADSRANSAYYSMIAFYNLAVIAITVLYRKSLNRNLYSLIAFLYLAQACNLVLAVLSGKLIEVSHLRYVYTLYFYPAIALSLILFSLRLNWMVISLGFASMAFLILENLGIWGHVNLQAPYTPMVACIDQAAKEYHLQNGLAEYWQARTVRMLSHSGLQISQVNQNLKFSNFTDNRKNIYAEYQFVIAKNLNEGKIQERYGKASHIINCQDSSVWLYEHISL